MESVAQSQEGEKKDVLGSVHFYTSDMDLEDVRELKKDIMSLTNASPISFPFVESHSDKENLLASMATHPDPENQVQASIEMCSLIGYVRDALFEEIAKGNMDESYMKDTLQERILLLENVQRGLYNTVAVVDAFLEDKETEYEASVDAETYYTHVLSKKAEEFMVPELKSPIPRIERINRTNEVSVEHLQKAMAWEENAFQIFKETIEFHNESNPILTDRITKVLQGTKTFMFTRYVGTAGMIIKNNPAVRKMMKDDLRHAFHSIDLKEYEKQNIDKELFLHLYDLYERIEDEKQSTHEQKNYTIFLLIHRMFAECRIYAETHGEEGWKRVAEMLSIKRK